MLLDILELASNSALQHDSKTQERLKKLQGNTMTLHIRPIDQSISVTPQVDGLEFSSTIPENVDVTLSATIGAMIKISRDGMQDADLKPGELEIKGDPIVGQRFAQVIADLEVDWEAALAEHLGDAPARMITIAAGHAKELADASQSRFKEFVSKLIKEDMSLVAGQQEVETFLDAVDQLRADTDRLMVRIQRLQNHAS